ncbi:MAG: FAD-dependent oxidoreductase [Lentisphaeria bacterium]|nr:FAD-dependent oxidoreductase [Lentisphaeria bacterium]
MSEKKNWKADFCVVGAGLAGMCAALSAARHGANVVVMHDRPIPGGNASSEIRMWVCGAHGKDLRETGLVEELLLENLYRNPGAVPAVWDSILYGSLEYAENIKLLLNCSCQTVKMNPDGSIASVTGYQTTTQTFHTVKADYFADCSGDSVLAPLTGAEYRHGRESCKEFDESIEPEKADDHTMGNSCLFQARQLKKKVKFTPPPWAKKFRKPEDIPPFRNTKLEGLENFWWMETGGLENTIRDSEKIRRDLLELAFGIWDYIKNYSPEAEKNAYWELDWVGFLPGKRESRRYVGDYIMNQNDVRGCGKFEDTIAYGGWSMDDHNPAGFYTQEKPTIFHPAPSPYGIPYRALYSKNIPNLFFAGRNISVSHAALSSTRVMATCATLGQACGTAAAIAIEEKISPRDVGKKHLKRLQQTLMEDDCFLPGFRREIPELSRKAALTVSNGADADVLRDGFDRNIEDVCHRWNCKKGDSAEYRFDQPQKISRIRIVFDSDLSRPEKNIVALRTTTQPELKLPSTLIKNFDLAWLSADGKWHTLEKVRNNWKRLFVSDDLKLEAVAVKLTILSGWGDNPGVFSWDIA